MDLKIGNVVKAVAEPFAEIGRKVEQFARSVENRVELARCRWEIRSTFAQVGALNKELARLVANRMAVETNPETRADILATPLVPYRRKDAALKICSEKYIARQQALQDSTAQTKACRDLLLNSADWSAVIASIGQRKEIPMPSVFNLAALQIIEQEAAYEELIRQATIGAAASALMLMSAI